MRKLILQMQISVDGLAAAAKNADIKWQIWDWGDKCDWDEKLKCDFNAVYASVDTILLSRKMVKGGFIDHWTDAAVKYPEDPFYKFAHKIVNIEKVVVTNKSFKSTWERTVILKGEFTKTIQKINGVQARTSSSLVVSASLLRS